MITKIKNKFFHISVFVLYQCSCLYLYYIDMCLSVHVCVCILDRHVSLLHSHEKTQYWSVISVHCVSPSHTLPLIM